MTPRQVHAAVAGVVALYGSMVEALEVLVSQLQANLKVVTDALEALRAQHARVIQESHSLASQLEQRERELEIVKRERDDARSMVPGSG